RSSASSREETSRRATRYTWSERSRASSSKRTRSRASAANRRDSVSCVVSGTRATLAAVSQALQRRGSGWLFRAVDAQRAATDPIAKRFRLRLGRDELTPPGGSGGIDRSEVLALGFEILTQPPPADDDVVRSILALLGVDEAPQRTNVLGPHVLP